MVAWHPLAEWTFHITKKEIRKSECHRRTFNISTFSRSLWLWSIGESAFSKAFSTLRWSKKSAKYGRSPISESSDRFLFLSGLFRAIKLMHAFQCRQKIPIHRKSLGEIKIKGHHLRAGSVEERGVSALTVWMLSQTVVGPAEPTSKNTNSRKAIRKVSISWANENRLRIWKL